VIDQAINNWLQSA